MDGFIKMAGLQSKLTTDYDFDNDPSWGRYFNFLTTGAENLVPIKDIKTGEIIRFNSMSEASFFLKGEGNYSATANILVNIKRLEEGKNSYCLGYRWYYQ